MCLLFVSLVGKVFELLKILANDDECEHLLGKQLEVVAVVCVCGCGCGCGGEKEEKVCCAVLCFVVEMKSSSLL